MIKICFSDPVSRNQLRIQRQNGSRKYYDLYR